MGKQIKIDRTKLKELLDMKNFESLAKASRDLGFTSSYLNYTLNRGTISKSGALLLEKIHGIKLSMYECVDENDSKQEEIEEKQTVVDLTSEELSDLIYKSVFSAVKHAWEDA